MSTLEATVSMLETLSEEDIEQVNGYIQKFVIKKDNPYRPLSEEEMLEQLAEARKQAEEGRVSDAKDVINRMREKYAL